MNKNQQPEEQKGLPVLLPDLQQPGGDALAKAREAQAAGARSGRFGVPQQGGVDPGVLLHEPGAPRLAGRRVREAEEGRRRQAVKPVRGQGLPAVAGGKVDAPPGKPFSVLRAGDRIDGALPAHGDAPQRGPGLRGGRHRRLRKGAQAGKQGRAQISAGAQKQQRRRGEQEAAVPPLMYRPRQDRRAGAARWSRWRACR